MAVASAVWLARVELVLALDDRLGMPTDHYVNGTQTWLTAAEPERVTLEWRLHPVGGYQPPRTLSHYELWEAAVDQLRGDADPEALSLGDERRGARVAVGRSRGVRGLQQRPRARDPGGRGDARAGDPAGRLGPRRPRGGSARNGSAPAADRRSSPCCSRNCASASGASRGRSRRSGSTRRSRSSRARTTPRTAGRACPATRDRRRRRRRGRSARRSACHVRRRTAGRHAPPPACRSQPLCAAHARIAASTPPVLRDLRRHVRPSRSARRRSRVALSPPPS